MNQAAMPKSKTPPKEISTRGLLRKVRKPTAPPAQIHPSKKKYKRVRIRPTEEGET
jgi:hypothetical protein